MTLLLLFATLFFFFSSDKNLSKITPSTYLEDTVSRNKWGVNVSGFIGTDLFWDTRQVVESRDGVLCLYPENVQRDINGKDINARPSFNFLALNTRVTLRVKAPDALGAKISGMVEGWYAGMSNNDMNGFSMRHAFIKMDWENSSLLMGQTWHPLFTEDYFATTIAGSAGSPFQPFSRSAQIRFTQKFFKTSKYWKRSKIMLYISSQRDFLSTGQVGASSSYLRNSAIPESGIQYIASIDNGNTNFFHFGFGYDYKYLIPRVITDSNLYTRNGVHSQAATAFLHYYNKSGRGMYGIKAKAIYTQGCNEFLMLGGYAYQYYDNLPLNPSVNYSYTTINTIATWLDIYTKIKQWEIGLFGGYTQNLGSHKNIQDWNNPNSYFSRGYNIQSVYRVSVRGVYQANKLQFGLEPEYTVACYGNTLNSLGEIQSPSADYPNAQKNRVANLRILFSTVLYF
jgi:hypothetical protein